MIISGVAIGQWNQLCRNKEGKRRTLYKIHRAIVMGKVAHVYDSNDYIIRYYDMNFLVDRTGLVQTIWRDVSTAPHIIRDEVKSKYDVETTHKGNIKKANKKHSNVINKIKREKGQLEGVNNAD